MTNMNSYITQFSHLSIIMQGESVLKTQILVTWKCMEATPAHQLTCFNIESMIPLAYPTDSFGVTLARRATLPSSVLRSVE